jgi:hypothetical protein
VNAGALEEWLIRSEVRYRGIDVSSYPDVLVLRPRMLLLIFVLPNRCSLVYIWMFFLFLLHDGLQHLVCLPFLFSRHDRGHVLSR